MSVCIVVGLLVMILVVIVVSCDSIDDQWSAYKVKFEKNYADEEEELMRKKNFIETVDYIKRVNVQSKKFGEKSTVGLNFFADWSKFERQQLIQTNKPFDKEFKKNIVKKKFDDIMRYLPQVNKSKLGNFNPPPSLDWRKVSPRRVSKVKSQGFCGGCWLFATVSTSLIISDSIIINR